MGQTARPASPGFQPRPILSACRYDGTYTLDAYSSGNQGGAYTFRLDLTTQTHLDLGTTYTEMLVATGQAQVFNFELPQPPMGGPGGTTIILSPLLVTLDGISDADHFAIYLKDGLPPTLSSFDFLYSGQGLAEQRICVPETEGGGNWYALLYADDVLSPGTFSINVTWPGTALLDVTPKRSGTSEDTTINLTGDGLGGVPKVQLVAGNGTTYTASSENFLGPDQTGYQHLGATFLAGAVPAGLYAVMVTNPNGTTATLPDAFTMVQGGLGVLQTQVIVPNPIGYHIASTIYVEYSNTGDAPMPAPLLVLTATQNGQEGRAHDP